MFVGVEIAFSLFLQTTHQVHLCLRISCGYAKLLYIAKVSSHVQTVLLAKNIAMQLPIAVAADAWHMYLGLLSTALKLSKHTYADRM